MVTLRVLRVYAFVPSLPLFATPSGTPTRESKHRSKSYIIVNAAHQLYRVYATSTASPSTPPVGSSPSSFTSSATIARAAGATAAAMLDASA